MRATLQVLTDELRRLKAAGVKTVPVSEDALESLRRVIRARAPQPVVAEAASRPARVVEPVATAPAPARSAPRDAGKPSLLEQYVQAGDRGAPSPVVSSAKPKPQPSGPSLPPAPELTLPAGDKATQWAWLRERVLGDRVCTAQVREGKKVVFGVGSLDAQIMFIGEAPGADEEVQGEPFVGPAGQLLTKMIQAMGVGRDQVYIGNILNWRPQLPVGADGVQYGNREPTPEEMDYCLPFLRAQIEVVKPAVIVALGATAAKGLLGVQAFRTVTEARSRWHDYLGRPVRVTYHPSYLLRKSSESKLAERKAKRAAWEDFLLVMERAGLSISEKQRGYFL